MDFSSLVLIERDKESNNIIKELGSYEVSEGAEYITKLYYDGEKVNVYFDTKKDVEDWEFSAIFDLFNEEAFKSKGYIIEDIDNEYNPTWLVKFEYDEEHEVVKDKLNELCGLIKNSIEEVFTNIHDKKNEYE